MRTTTIRVALAAVALGACATAAAAPVAPSSAQRRAMCAAAKPAGVDVRCRSARISGVDRHWGRVTHSYRGGGSGGRQRRTGWVRRGSTRSRHWALRAVVTGPDHAPCGRGVPVKVVREFYGRRACR